MCCTNPVTPVVSPSMVWSRVVDWLAASCSCSLATQDSYITHIHSVSKHIVINPSEDFSGQVKSDQFASLSRNLKISSVYWNIRCNTGWYSKATSTYYYWFVSGLISVADSIIQQSAMPVLTAVHVQTLKWWKWYVLGIPKIKTLQQITLQSLGRGKHFDTLKIARVVFPANL